MYCSYAGGGWRQRCPCSSLYLHQHDAWDAQEILKLLDLWPSLSSSMAELTVLGGQQRLVFVGAE